MGKIKRPAEMCLLALMTFDVVGAVAQQVTVTESLMRYGLGTLNDNANSTTGLIATAGCIGVVIWDPETGGGNSHLRGTYVLGRIRRLFSRREQSANRSK